MCVNKSLCLNPSNSVGMKTQPESKCPELLANYCDMLLRKTPLSKKLTSEEIELKLKEVVSLCLILLASSEKRESVFVPSFSESSLSYCAPLPLCSF